MPETATYWLPQLIAGVTSTIVAFYLWRRRSASGAKNLMVLMIATAEWALLSALHKVSPDLSTKVLLAKIQYLGIVTVPLALLAFTLQYTGRERWLTIRNLILMAIVPGITLTLVWTNEGHHLIWKRIWLDTSGPIPIGVYDYGPWFWIWTFFVYLTVLLSTIWLVRAFIRSQHLYRMQILVMLIGIAAPWLANILYLSGLNPWPRIDLTPIAFTLTGLAIGWGLFWFRISDIVPVARETVLESIPDGIIVLDYHNRIVNLNPAAQKILCLSDSEVIGQSALLVFADQPVLIERLGDVTELRSEIILGEDDTQHYYDLYISPLKDRQDNFIGRLLTLRDFTQRKQTEEAFKKSEVRYRALFEAADDAIFIANVIDQDLRFEEFNPKALKIFNCKNEELANLTPLDISPSKQPDGSLSIESALPKIQEALKGKPQHFNWQHCSLDGTPFDAEVTLNRITIGNELYMQGIVRDITEKKRTEEEKRRLESQLQQSQKMEAIATLAGGIAHEFNNALMGISGNIELLQMKLPDDDDVRDCAEAMKVSCRRMANLTVQLLAYARGGMYQPKAISLSDLVNNTLPSIKHTIDPNIRVETDLMVDISNVVADFAQMQMVLAAVLNNSIEAMDCKGRIRIITRNEELDEEFVKSNPDINTGAYVSLAVEDDGKGMGEEAKSKIFEPFFTTKFQGRGLGMAAVFGIVKNHGGWISVDSELDKGTVVHIYLPAVDIQIKKEKKPKTDLVEGKGTILVIEDEDIIIDVISPMLKRLGYRVIVAKTGKEAINFTETFNGNIDLALLDIKLPDMEGGKLYPRIRENRPNLKVIVCSGYAIDGPAQEILDAGAQDFIQKPFTFTALSGKLKEVLAAE